MHEISGQRKLWILSGQLFHAAGVGMWCFSPDNDFIYSTSPNEEEYRIFLEISGCLDFANEHPERLTRPALLTDTLGITWVIEHFVTEEHGTEFLIIMGPMFTSDRSLRDIETSLRGMDLSIETRSKMKLITEGIPVVSRAMVKQYAVMLHFAMTEEGIKPQDFIYREPKEQLSPAQAKSGEERGHFEIDTMRQIKSEEQMLQAIREGNENYASIIEQGSTVNNGEFITNTGNYSEDARLSMIVFCALASRAAIEGGAVAATAKKIEKQYLEEIEKCKSVDKLVQIKSDLISNFVALVAKVRDAGNISHSVQSCCDYIHANVQSPMTAESLAQRYGYTKYYFTKKFYKEVGIRLDEYIRNARIDYAKVLLLSTRKSIDDISFDLLFANRNYFSTVFRDRVGVTPAAYRARAGDIPESS